MWGVFLCALQGPQPRKNFGAGVGPSWVDGREAIRALDSNDLYKILTQAEDSILLQFQMLWRGVEMVEMVELGSKLALSSDTG